MSHSSSQSTNKMLNTLPKPTRDLTELAKEERSFTFNHFTCEHAWVIGNILRNALRTAECPALIQISSANQTLFHSPSLPGIMPDHEKWSERKRNTVLRWGHSTWFMSCQFEGDYKRFAEHNAMSGDEWSRYPSTRSESPAILPLDRPPRTLLALLQRLTRFIEEFQGRATA